MPATKSKILFQSEMPKDTPKERWGSLVVREGESPEALDVDVDSYFGFWRASKDRLTYLLSGRDIDELYIRINSPGGSLYDCIEMYNYIGRLKEEKGCFVTTDFVGPSASAATVFGMIGDHIKAANNIGLLIHFARMWASGTAEEIEKQLSEIKMYNHKMAMIYAKRSGYELESVKKLMHEDTSKSVEFMMGIGLLDEIYEPDPSLRKAA